MENIRVLCCGTRENRIGYISSFLDLLEQNIGIQIKKITGMCLADFEQDEVDEENLEYHEPIEAQVEFNYQSKKCLLDIERITKNGNRILEFQIQYDDDDDIMDLGNSVWFDFKENLINLLHSNFAQIYWLADSQNKKIATDLYERMYALENYLREIINSYMCVIHGGDWFEKYSYEDFVNKYLKFSEWFRNSKYNLFKQVDSHLFNLEIDDIFDALKVAKKKQLPGVVKKALEEIKEKEKENAADIANIELLNSPSLWEEEKLSDIFSAGIVGRWKNDLSKRRNMIAHNKMICREMYCDTLKSIDFFMEEFEKADARLKRRIHSEESIEISRIQRDNEIAMNLEYCEINPDLLEEQDIIEKLNETDDFMTLTNIIEDRIARIGEKIDELMGELDDIESCLNVDNFFDEDQFVGKNLLMEYIEFAKEHSLSTVWKTLLEKGMSVEVYTLIEPGIEEYILDIKSRLGAIKESIYYVDMECLSEGTLVRLQNFAGDIYNVSLSGWLCPERGATNQLYINWLENGEQSVCGGIYISYGDYEMTEDDIPIPCVEDEMVVNFQEVNIKLEEVAEGIFDKLSSLEDDILSIQI